MINYIANENELNHWKWCRKEMNDLRSNDSFLAIAWCVQKKNKSLEDNCLLYIYFTFRHSVWMLPLWNRFHLCLLSNGHLMSFMSSRSHWLFHPVFLGNRARFVLVNWSKETKNAFLKCFFNYSTSFFFTAPFTEYVILLR